MTLDEVIAVLTDLRRTANVEREGLDQAIAMLRNPTITAVRCQSCGRWQRVREGWDLDYTQRRPRIFIHAITVSMGGPEPERLHESLREAMANDDEEMVRIIARAIERNDGHLS